MPSATKVLAFASTILAVKAHVAAWHPSMWCFSDNDGNPNAQNAAAAHLPLYMLKFKDWWMHAVNGCDKYPPAANQFLELPAGGSFPIQLANNRAFTTYSYNGSMASEWPNGQQGPPTGDSNMEGCITNPNIHTTNESMAAGTAFAISYVDSLSKVTPNNLVVFSIRYHTPWRRETTYDVPKSMPPCPSGGCICVWGWVPNGCGQRDMYMMPYRCKVTGATSRVPLAVPKAPVWCEENSANCTKGAKQMIYWHQLERNNIAVEGKDLSGMWKSPAYNMKLGFANGAQNDIFQKGITRAASRPSRSLVEAGAIVNEDSQDATD